MSTRAGAEVPRGRPARHRPPTFEGLERRSLLSINSVVTSGGALLVTSDAADSIVISSAAGSGDVQIDGDDPNTGPFPSRDVTTIQVTCNASSGADATVIDLGGVTPADFSDLTSVDVEGGGSNDQLIGPNVPVTWGVTSADAGILAGPALGQITSFTFTSIGSLVGGTGDDSFVFAQGASLSGSIDGGGGDDTLDFSGISDPVSVTLTGSDDEGFAGTATGLGMGFRGIEVVIGGLGTSTLTGDDANSTWNLDANPTYSDGTNTLSFSQFGDLQGGSGANTFDLIGDSLGNLAENIVGGVGDDQFLFEGDVSLAGTIDGGGGYATLDFGEFGIAVDVELTGSSPDGYSGTEPTAFNGGGFRRIDAVIGHQDSVAPDTITGEDTSSTWSLGQTSSYEDDSGIPLMFSGFGEIDAGTGDDTYRLNPPSGSDLILNDPGGDNTLDFSRASFPVTIDADSSAPQSIGPDRTLTLSGFFENVIGSPFAAAITIAGSETPRFVDGGPPATSPGGVLTFDAGDLPVTLTATQIMAGTLAPVTYSGFESLNIINDSGLTLQDMPTTLTWTANPVAPQYGSPLTFTLDVAASPRGPAMPTGTVQFAIDGVPFGPAVALAQGAATSPPIATLDAGEHTISASYSGDASFAANTASPMAVDVTEAPLLVLVQDATRMYGQDNPAFTASYSGFVLGQGPSVLGGNLAFSTAAAPASHVGTYSILASGVTSDDYSITFVPGTLTVTPAPLTIAAVDVTKGYGLPVPTLTAVYTGFVNGDGPWSLATPVTLTTTATATSAPGSYPIIAGGAASPDYTITFVNGVLAVSSSTTTSRPRRTAFVTTLYQDVLGRAPDDPGLDYWVKQMGAGMPRAEVNREFFGSAERRMLRKEHSAPEISEETALDDAIRSARLATVALDIFPSPEHKALLSQHKAPRINDRTALADSKAETTAVRTNAAYPTGPMALRSGSTGSRLREKNRLPVGFFPDPADRVDDSGSAGGYHDAELPPIGPRA